MALLEVSPAQLHVLEKVFRFYCTFNGMFPYSGFFARENPANFSEFSRKFNNDRTALQVIEDRVFLDNFKWSSRVIADWLVPFGVILGVLTLSNTLNPMLAALALSGAVFIALTVQLVRLVLFRARRGSFIIRNEQLLSQRNPQQWGSEGSTSCLVLHESQAVMDFNPFAPLLEPQKSLFTQPILFTESTKNVFSPGQDSSPQCCAPNRIKRSLTIPVFCIKNTKYVILKSGSAIQGITPDVIKSYRQSVHLGFTALNMNCDMLRVPWKEKRNNSRLIIIEPDVEVRAILLKDIEIRLRMRQQSILEPIMFLNNEQEALALLQHRAS